jgi:HK97 gp10 family phage protein
MDHHALRGGGDGMSIDGRDRLLAKMAAIPAEVRKQMAAALNQGADEIVGLQKRLAPKRTGALAASIVATSGGSTPSYSTFKGKSAGGAGDPDLSVRISAGNAKVRYAHLVEFGTAPHINGGKFAGSQNPGARAQPFFFPAWRALKRKVKGRVTRATKAAVRSFTA